MTGWNMPPGCSVRDIPGNRPEDEAAEALYEKVDKLLTEHLGADVAISDELREAFINFVMRMIGEGYAEGYKIGQAEAGYDEDNMD